MLYLITGITLAGILIGYLSVKGNPSDWLGFTIATTVTILAIMAWPATLVFIWIYREQFIDWIEKDL